MSLTTTAVLVSSSPGKIQLTVTSSPSVTDLVQLFRVHTDATVHRVLVESNAVIIGTWSGYDYHAPLNQAVTYYATTPGLQSPNSSGVTIASTKLWLTHQSDTTLSVQPTKWITNTAVVYKRADRSQKFQVLGKSLPVTRTGYPRAQDSGTLTIKCVSAAERTAVKNLLADSGPLLINTPYSDDEIGWAWVQPGELSMTNPAPYTSFGFRYAEFPYEECEQPDSDLTPLWAYKDVTTAYPFPSKTYATLKTDYAAKNYTSLKLHV